MPSIGSYEYPNHDIDRIVELVDEAANRVTISSETVSEDTFKSEIINKAGGTYNRYRYSLQLYGLIEREYGSEEVTITDLFVNIADPLGENDREEAIRTVVGNIVLFVEMYEADFGPEFSDREFRKWLIEDKSVPRKKISQDQISEIRSLYDSAFEYFVDLFTTEKDEIDQTDEPEGEKKEKGDASIEVPSGHSAGPNSSDTDIEEIRIGNKVVMLPKEDVKKEWKVLRATVDAYINSLDEDD